MKWDNLGDNRCPKCYSSLIGKELLDEALECPDQECGFKISQLKFIEITTRIRRRRADSFDPDKNLSELNNL